MKNNRIGEIKKNKHGTYMKIIHYYNATNITIQFLDEYKIQKKVTYQSFINGNVKNSYDKSLCDTGYLGVGKYTESNIFFNYWRCMILRCYSVSNDVYKNCTVCDKWHNYQNFAEWCNNNYYEIPNEKMQLDKDILHKSNKIYSPENCVFVSQSINKLFTKCDKARGNYLIGVNYNKGMFQARCRNGNSQQINLGRFNTEKDAYMVYKNYKEKVIKQIANKYIDQIPINLYNAMINYQVEIND